MPPTLPDKDGLYIITVKRGDSTRTFPAHYIAATGHWKATQEDGGEEIGFATRLLPKDAKQEHDLIRWQQPTRD